MTARLVLLLALLLPMPAWAQAPTSAIAGTVRDSAGGVVGGTTVVVVNSGTGDRRTTLTSASGTYRADQLPAGAYRVTIDARGFAPASVTAQVVVGAVATADLTLAPVGPTEPVSVEGDVPTVDRERPGVDTLIPAATIESLPLNGRNALDLVPLAPGLTAPVRASNNRVFVAADGSGLQTQPRVGDTRVTVDGFNVGYIDATGSVLNVSPDVLEAVEISTANFDAVTGLTTNGAVNLVTRSGSNQATGSVVGFLRDHAFAASPALTVDLNNPDPYFRRWQFGGTAGGPVIRNRVFVFGDVERTSQEGVVSVELPAPFTALGGIVPSPFAETLATAKGDARLTDRAHLSFVSIDDRNRGIGPTSGDAVTTTLPSDWSSSINDVSLNGVTFATVLSRTAVNEFRASLFRLTSLLDPTTAADCAAIGSSCVGVGDPTIQIVDKANAPPLLTLGPSRTLTFVGHRDELADTFTWQRGRQRVHLGVDFERDVSTANSLDHDPAAFILFSPAAAAKASVPLQSTTFLTASDILGLPLQSAQTSVGPAVTLWRNFQPVRVTDATRLFAADSWQISSRWTVAASLGWSDEPNALNSDLAKPLWLAPLVGGIANLGPPETHPQWSPATGLTWSVTADGRTVVRIAAGRFVDPATSTNPVNMGNERVALMPEGTGRFVDSLTVDPVTNLPLSYTTPGTMTGAALLADLQQIQNGLAGKLNPGNRDFSTLNIDALKSASDLSDAAFGQPSAIHVNAGVTRQLRAGLLVGADVVWRRFEHTFLTGIDVERFGSTDPLIPRCVGADGLDLAAICANNSITFDTTDGHARNLALLLHVDDEHLGWLQVHVAYALSTYTGTNGTGAGTGFNNYNWLANDGPLPTDRRHVLNTAGLVRLPGQFDLAVNLALASAEPFSAYLGGVDLDGDGTTSDLLPGSTVGAFGRSLGPDDLRILVWLYNHTYAQTSPFGPVLPTITLPASFSFGAVYATVDVRLTRTFALRSGGGHLALIAEVFNLFNRRNYTGYNEDLTRSNFGQPTGLVSQVFGAGGPRAAQFGLRLTF